MADNETLGPPPQTVGIEVLFFVGPDRVGAKEPWFPDKNESWFDADRFEVDPQNRFLYLYRGHQQVAVFPAESWVYAHVAEKPEPETKADPTKRVA